MQKKDSTLTGLKDKVKIETNPEYFSSDEVLYHFNENSRWKEE